MWPYWAEESAFKISLNSVFLSWTSTNSTHCALSFSPRAFGTTSWAPVSRLCPVLTSSELNWSKHQKDEAHTHIRFTTGAEVCLITQRCKQTDLRLRMSHFLFLLLQAQHRIHVLLQLLNQIPKLQDDLWETPGRVKTVHLHESGALQGFSDNDQEFCRFMGINVRF